VKRETVPLSRVAWRDRRFSFSRGGGLEELTASIENIGLLDPPELLNKQGRYIIIRGARRLQALRRLGRKHVEAHIFRENEISPLQAWSRNFHENRASRDLNPAEKCTALRQLAALGLSPQKIVSGYFPLLGLPRREGGYEAYLSVAHLPDTMLDLLADGAITLGTAVYLATLGENESRSAFRFLKKAALTVGQQREWARLVADVSARGETSVPALLASVSRTARRRHGQFGASALQVLRERRFPSLAARRSAFQRLLRRLRLPPGFQVTTHPFFEKSELHVRFSAAGEKGYADALHLLERLRREESFRLLMEPGKRPAKK
jgi:ParB-like chromosome segregation protein Spo0J